MHSALENLFFFKCHYVMLVTIQPMSGLTARHGTALPSGPAPNTDTLPHRAEGIPSV